MKFTDDKIRQAAKERVAHVFNINPDTLAVDSVFGEELKCSFTSDWKLNEYDLLLEDIQDVADERLKDLINSERLVIRTVDEYCEYMMYCYRYKPKEVVSILFQEIN